MHPSDLMQHALVHASSQLRPHIMAATDLIAYHKQQLAAHHDALHQHHNALFHPHLNHHHHDDHHHHHSELDMATSESTRLGTIAAARGTVLAHFWPLAVALLPIMIIVAIMAQLVMAAPLVMFAMTTLAVSRFMGTMTGPVSNLMRRDGDNVTEAHPGLLSEDAVEQLRQLLGLDFKEVVNNHRNISAQTSPRRGKQHTLKSFKRTRRRRRRKRNIESASRDCDARGVVFY